MKTYLVGVREVHVSYMEVKANTPTDAFDMIRNGEGDEVSMDYSHTLDPETWTVEESPGVTI
jgi:hypothetical protein